MHCLSNEHNFIQVDVYTGGTKYQCAKCGLEAHASMLSGDIYKEYFGSYIGGVSHVWNPSDMSAENISSFSIWFGDLPIANVKYDGTVMKVKNSINGSRDGWMSFPKGYFDEKKVKLSRKEQCKLKECLGSLDFTEFTTDQDLFRNFGAPGFCISSGFKCRFFNGRGFECLSPRNSEFTKLVVIVKELIGMKQEAACKEALCDNQETGWLCSKCGAGNKFDYKICGKCGTKRPW